MTEQEEDKGKRAEVINNLTLDLKSKDERKIISALKRIPHEGSSDMIEPMLDLVMSGPSDDVRILLEKILFSLKDTACIPALLSALQSEKYKSIHFIILGAFWQSGLDVSQDLSIIVGSATGGDYMTAVEAMSIIENSEGYSDKELAKSIKLLDAALMKNLKSHALLEGIREMLVDQLLE